jgi:mRNA-degrading endonuclease toxin of MazEF toxin-antitoxin module
MKYRRGEVVLAFYPVATGIGSSRRPCVVVQNDVDNQKIDNAVVAQITTNLARASDKSHVLIEVKSAAGRLAGLLHDSVISCNNLATIHETRIQHRIGILGPATLHQLDGALKAALELP